MDATLTPLAATSRGTQLSATQPASSTSRPPDPRLALLPSVAARGTAPPTTTKEATRASTHAALLPPDPVPRSCHRPRERPPPRHRRASPQPCREPPAGELRQGTAVRATSALAVGPKYRRASSAPALLRVDGSTDGGKPRCLAPAPPRACSRDPVQRPPARHLRGQRKKTEANSVQLCSFGPLDLGLGRPASYVNMLLRV